MFIECKYPSQNRIMGDFCFRENAKSFNDFLNSVSNLFNGFQLVPLSG
jgi:hypothetical protein